MPDNVTLPPTGAGTPNIKVATRKITYSGEEADIQPVGLVTFAGADDAKTVADVPGGLGPPGPAMRVVEAVAGSVDVTNIMASTTTVTLQAANPDRLGWSCLNVRPSDLYLKLGSGASLTSHTVIVPPGGYYELPFRYTGIITGFWAATANGSSPSTSFRVSLNPQGDAAIDERWVINGNSNPTLGTFKVTFGADTTPALAFNISTPDLIAALEALSSVGPGNVIEDPNNMGYTLPLNGVVALQWVNDLGASDQPLATITDNTTDTTLGVVESQPGFGPSTITPTGGTFTLLLSIDYGPVVETAPIAWDADRLTVRTAIADALGVDEGDIRNDEDGPLPYSVFLHFDDGITVDSKAITVEVGDVSLDDPNDPPVVISDYEEGGPGVARVTEYT